MRTGRQVLDRGPWITICYVNREGDHWHRTRVTPEEYLAIVSGRRLGGMTFAAVRVAGSCLIRDLVLDQFYPERKPCYRILNSFGAPWLTPDL